MFKNKVVVVTHPTKGSQEILNSSEKYIAEGFSDLIEKEVNLVLENENKDGWKLISTQITKKDPLSFESVKFFGSISVLLFFEKQDLNL
jgi:hypothetical protein